jgi:hypothetical protein
MASSDSNLASRQKPSRKSAGVDQNRKSRRGRPMKETSGDVSEVRISKYMFMFRWLFPDLLHELKVLAVIPFLRIWKLLRRLVAD